MKSPGVMGRLRERPARHPNPGMGVRLKKVRSNDGSFLMTFSPDLYMPTTVPTWVTRAGRGGPLPVAALSTRRP